MSLPIGWYQLPEEKLLQLRDRVDEIDIDLIDNELNARADFEPPPDTPALDPPWWESR